VAATLSTEEAVRLASLALAQPRVFDEENRAKEDFARKAVKKSIESLEPGEVKALDSLNPSKFQEIAHNLDPSEAAELASLDPEGVEARASKMNQDDFGITYATNVQKVLGGTLPREQLYSKVRRGIYKYLKMNLRNIIQYEFSF
jgi:hypothetical protein